MKKEEILNLQNGQLSLLTGLFQYLFGRRYCKADKTTREPIIVLIVFQLHSHLAGKDPTFKCDR